MMVGTVDGTSGGLRWLLERFRDAGLKELPGGAVGGAGVIPAVRRPRQ